MRSHDAAKRLGNFRHVENDFAVAVDPDHRRHIGDGYPLLICHDLGNDASFDAVIHGYAALMGNRCLETNVFHRFENVVLVLGHRWLLFYLTGLRVDQAMSDAGARMPTSV